MAQSKKRHTPPPMKTLKNEATPGASFAFGKSIGGAIFLKIQIVWAYNNWRQHAALQSPAQSSHRSQDARQSKMHLLLLSCGHIANTLKRQSNRNRINLIL